MARRIRKGDLVEVITGRHAGQQGKIIEVMVDADRVRVEGLMVKRHLKAGRDPKIPQGGIIEKLASVHISNVLPVDPLSGKPTRIGFKTLEDGRKVRFAKRSGELLG